MAKSIHGILDQGTNENSIGDPARWLRERLTLIDTSGPEKWTIVILF